MVERDSIYVQACDALYSSHYAQQCFMRESLFFFFVCLLFVFVVFKFH